MAAALDTPAAITAAGLNGSDAQAVTTLSVFGEHLGRVAGDVALVFMAYGGVYLAGGITTLVLPRLARTLAVVSGRLATVAWWTPAL